MASGRKRGIAVVLARGLALGVATGLRSMAAPAMLATITGASECKGCAPAPLRAARSKPGRTIFAFAALGEIVGDKLPLAPPRIQPGPLGGRVAFGAVSALLATRATRAGASPTVQLLGIAVGGVGAALGSFAGYQARVVAVRETELPDLPFALVEDGVAYALAAVAARA